MPGQNKTRLIGWHPQDPTLKAWIKKEAARRGVPERAVLDEALAAYRAAVTAAPDSPERASAWPGGLADDIRPRP